MTDRVAIPPITGSPKSPFEIETARWSRVVSAALNSIVPIASDMAASAGVAAASAQTTADSALSAAVAAQDAATAAAAKPGDVWIFGRSIPSGWLLCDGSAVQRGTYAALFTAIGTTYGAGDGVLTFNLPYLTALVVDNSGVAGVSLDNIEKQAFNVAIKV